MAKQHQRPGLMDALAGMQGSEQTNVATIDSPALQEAAPAPPEVVAGGAGGVTMDDFGVVAGPVPDPWWKVRCAGLPSSEIQAPTVDWAKQLYRQHWKVNNTNMTVERMP